MLYTICILAGLSLLAYCALGIGKRNPYTASTVSCFMWGIGLFFSGLNIVMYNEIQEKGLYYIALYLVLFIAADTFARSWKANENPTQYLNLTEKTLARIRVISILVILGIIFRTVFLVSNGRRFWEDIGLAYEAKEALTGNMLSRLSYLLFLWPLPAAISVWHYFELKVSDRILFLSASLGLAIYGLSAGGRSGIVFTGAFMGILLLLSLKSGPNSKASLARKRRLILQLSVVCLLMLTFLLYVFTRRMAVKTGRTYSEGMEINPAYLKVLPQIQNFALGEGVVGMIGYLGSPVQQLSAFMVSDYDGKLYGGFNFDMAAQLLSKIGVVGDGYERAQDDLAAFYMGPMNAPVGTFSTCIRDYWLDFGVLGVIIGAAGMGLVTGRLYFITTRNGGGPTIPLLGFAISICATAPFFSGFSLSGANLSLVGACVGYFLYPRSSEKKVVPLSMPVPEPPKPT
jgi:oligosaccharide repeat unit polymerase